MLIIENPELHLHPKAQSELALFLSTVAHAGVQVVIETHSDHIVNGVRKSVLFMFTRLLNMCELKICSGYRLVFAVYFYL